MFKPKKFEKDFTLKGQNLLPHGSKFFPFKVDPFLATKKKQLARVASPDSVSVSHSLYVQSDYENRYENTPIQIYRKVHLQKIETKFK